MKRRFKLVMYSFLLFAMFFVASCEKKTFTVQNRCDMILKLSRTACGLVAQLDRVFDYESKGRGFESRGARQ